MTGSSTPRIAAPCRQTRTATRRPRVGGRRHPARRRCPRARRAARCRRGPMPVRRRTQTTTAPRRRRRRVRPRSPARCRPPADRAAARPERDDARAAGARRPPARASSSRGPRQARRRGRHPRPPRRSTSPNRRPRAERSWRTAAAAGARARADVGGDDRQSPRHRRAVTRRRPVGGQDAVAARLAARASTC